jgi:Flp pilus assembly protein TadG
MNLHERQHRSVTRALRCRTGWASRWLRERTGGDAGQMTPFAVLMTIALLAVAGLVLDAGLALSEKVRALDIAQAAARAGAQELDLYKYRTSNVAELDPARAASAARAWLASAGVEGEATATITTVTVTVRRTSDTQLLQIVGVRQLAVSATATATAVQGVTGPNT